MTPERRKTIVLLLSSKWDAIHTPPLSRAEQGAARGEVGTLRVACPICGGDRWTRDKFNRPTPCTYCGGELEHMDGVKRVDAKEGRGWVAIDEYTETEPQPSVEPDRGIIVRVVHCDRCDRGVRAERPCEHCAGTGQVRLLGDRLRAAHTPRDRFEDTIGDPRLVRQQRWCLLGSYAPLDEALAGLSALMPVARRMLWLVYESGQLRESDLSAPLRRRLEFGLRYLDRALPRRLRVPRSVREAAARRHVNGETAERVRRYRFEPTLEHPEGAPLFAVEIKFSLSRAQVLDVLGRTG